MSTQSPTPPTPKGSRNNRRNQKRNTTPSTQSVSILATPPSSPPRAVSPRGTATDSSNNIPQSKKKTNRSAKKPRDVPKTSPPVNKISHRHTSSHPSNIATPQLKDSPHYAGPTFHASPAPSALPIPSFFSKSLPDSDVAPASEPDSDSFEPDPDIENTPSKPKSRPLIPKEEQSTPLDFLFKAAVEARKSQSQRRPEPSPRARSPQTDSKALQQRKYNNGISGVFPLDMESPELRHSQIGPSFAPSYKDRMNALRSASSPSPTLKDLDEDERRAKTEALKNLLLNPRPQRPSSTSNSAHGQPNGYKERPALSPMVSHFATPLRTSSGPPSTGFYNVPFNQTPRGRNESYSQSPHAHLDSPQHFQSQGSILRREVLSSNPGNAPSTPKQALNSPFAVFSNQQTSNYYAQASSKSPVSRTAPSNANSQPLDTKKMEDDLRRILKLDVNPGLQTSGIQSSLA